jgi:4-amino-4-deoxy-L-arabinose transferase-like glycosyltransferase
VGLLAAGFTAVYTYFIYYAATLMTEPFYIVTILLSLLFAVLYVEQGRASKPEHKKDLLWGVLLGLSLGATILFRQIFLLFLPFLFVWVWWARRHQAGRAPFLPLVISAALV